MRDYVGQQLGTYQLLQLLGQGHWGSVYLGEHVHLHTQAAIKVLHGPWADSEVEGFLGEARTLAHLRHPHIVRVLDFGVQEGTPFLVMEYAPDGTLRQLHPKGMRLPLQTVVSYVKQVASALQYAHEQRLIHRDLKPENLLLGHDQQIWLADFGLAIVAHSARSQPLQQSAGTLAYMAPEQLQGHPIPASDQYALGVVAYEWLAGERPFSGSYTEVAAQQTLASPPSLCEKVPTLPSAVEHVVFRALAKDPSARFPTVEAFARALEEVSREDTSGRTVLVPAAEPLADPERRSSSHGLPTGTVTLLFSDIEGSTRLLQQLGAGYEMVLADCRILLRRAFQAHHGQEVDTQGDSFFVAFARATDAAEAAVEMQRALAFHAWPNGVTVRVRMGLHTGEPSQTAEGYVGLDVHHAARIMGVGHGGQVLLSQTTRDLVEHDLPGGVSLQDLGAHRLKDLQHPSHLFQLVIAGLPADFPPLLTLDRRPNNLPIQFTTFIGREQEVSTVQHLLQRAGVRLLTLTGPGGTGKTRLGLQVAAELSEVFPDGVFFVNLAPISDPALVVPTIAQTLEVKEVADQALLDLVKALLREKQVLLLLDNFEQVVGAGVHVTALLAACPQLKVLVTSREVLHVRGEQEFAVPPLSLPDPKRLPDLLALSQYEAVALFIQRAQAVRPEFEVTNANAPAVAEICVRLDGLPLAIELAAARIKVLPPQALLARLGQRLVVLTSAARDVPARQQTLRNTIAWSYDLLSAEEQRLFRHLSVFVGGCTLEAVEACCNVGSDQAMDIVDGVASLVDKSLVRQTEQEGEEPRLLMLETIREYGLECLAASGEMEETRHAHAAYYLQLSEKAEPQLRSAQQAVWLARLESEHDNLRAALRWSIEHRASEMALRLGGALWHFWAMRGHWSEGRTFLEQGLASSEGVAAAVRAKALNGAGVFMGDQGDFEQAMASCEESLALFKELGDTQGTALSLLWLGATEWLKRDLASSRSLLEEALTLFRRLDDTWGMAISLEKLASVAVEQGEYTRARSLVEESLALYREVGDKSGIANALFVWAWMLLWSEGELERAHSMLEESLALSREVGNKGVESFGEFLLGMVAFFQGEYTRARPLVEESLALSRKMGSQRFMALGLFGQGSLAFVQGDALTAHALLKESLALFRKIDDQSMMAYCLENLAVVVVAQGQLAWGVRLWGAVETVREARGIPRPSAMRLWYEQSLATARAGLGEEAFAAVWAEGRAMTPEQALSAQAPVTTTKQPAPARAPTPPRPAYPDGLTEREVDVLRLVALGMTDAQVADQLVLSPRTVQGHLRSIYNKIMVNSRNAATRYAVEHQLV